MSIETSSVIVADACFAEQEYIELPDLTVDFRLPRGLDLPDALVELLEQYTPDEPEYSDHHVPYVKPSLHCLMYDLSCIESLYNQVCELAEFYADEGKPDYIMYIVNCFVEAVYGKYISVLCEVEKRTNPCPDMNQL
jgi:hypothetical protein